MADTAYDTDHLRQAIAAKGALAVIPNNPSRALKYLLDKHLYAQRHLVECCLSKLSSNSAASQPASKRPHEITGLSSLSQPSSYGCDKCPLGASFINARGNGPHFTATRPCFSGVIGIAELLRYRRIRAALVKRRAPLIA